VRWIALSHHFPFSQSADTGVTAGTGTTAGECMIGPKVAIELSASPTQTVDSITANFPTSYFQKAEANLET
jgi:hypothetical protein